ncbi:MAG: alpha/beta hydrolase [Myxococcota bacterium]
MNLLALAGCMTMDGFFFANEPLAQYSLASDVIPADALELVSFDSTDHVKLYGVWAHQATPGAQVFAYFHGNAAHIDAYMDKVEVYWGMGYEVFVFDYRGFGMSTGTPTHDGVLEDGKAAVEYLEETTGLAPEQVVFHGLSLGGFVSVHVAGDYPPKVLITEDMFASGQKLMDDGSGLSLPQGWMLEDEWDNVSAAAAVPSPYLIVHGAEDTYVQPSHAEEVYAAANDPKRLWLVPGADHAQADVVDPGEYAANVTCWVAQTCPE